MPKPLFLLVLGLGVVCRQAYSAGPAAAAAEPEYLSNHPELILSAQQSWGELGWDAAAHAAGQGGAPLQIGDRTYPKGLGHHANGSIAVLLDGRFAAFDAEVGLQPCGGGGSVIFRVFVDGHPAFDSGVLRATNAPVPIHVTVVGAQELRLEAGDGGDGNTCDMANWAAARLTRATAALAHTAPTVDIAPFGRVVTWDPHRTDGARASRIEEFHAEDLFLETDVPPGVDGAYHVPVTADGLGCIGLQWLNRRALKSLALEFASASVLPPTNAVQVQGWFGESAWQGGWKPLHGELALEGNRLWFHLSPKAGLTQSQKVRWLFPATTPPRLRSLSAFTWSRWDTASLRIEAEKPATGAAARISAINGEFLSRSAGDRDVGASKTSLPARTSEPSDQSLLPRLPGRRGQGRGGPSIDWNLKHPVSLMVRYSRPSSFKSDPTVLQFQLPAGVVSVAVTDVLSNECVYLPDYGLFITRDPAPVTLADYKRRIASHKTILQQVRQLPDQTLAQAMTRTHHDAQREGPVMLSLACDNTKFVLERDGTLRFPGSTNSAADWFAAAGEVRPRFGSGQGGQLTRALDGGWLPIPVITVEKDGLLWRERVFVAPGDAPGTDPARLNRPSLCIVEFTVSNAQPIAAQAMLALDFLANTRQRQPAALPAERDVVFALPDGVLNGMLVVSKSCPLLLQATGSKAEWLGTLSPGRTAQLTVCLADPRVDLADLRPRLHNLRDDTAAYWQAVLAPAMQVETPEPLLNDLIRSSQVRCLVAARNEADGARIAPWIAAMSYGPLESEANSVLRGMAFMGHKDFTRRGLDFFIHRYNTHGFLTTGYTLFGTPWHLWTLSEQYQLYRDTNWLRRVAPEISRVGDWLMRQTDKTRRSAAVPGRSNSLAAQRSAHPPTALAPASVAAAEDGSAPESGLMPPGVLADWNAFAYHFTMNAYCYAALHGVASALADLDKPEGRTPRAEGRSNPEAGISAAGGSFSPAVESVRFQSAADQLRSDILRAYHWTQSQAPALPLRNGTWIPHYPSQVHSPGKLADFFPGQDGGRSWCYDVELGAHQLIPTGVLDARSRETERIMDHMEDVQFLADGWFDYPASANEQDWFNLGGFSKVQPYYTRNCEVYALRDDVKPFLRSYFNTIAAMLNPEVMTFWEHFHHSGAWDKTHETGYFLHQTRTMLLTERGNALWLAPMLTTNWLADGQHLVVSNAPTRFGPVSYRLDSRIGQGLITATIQPPTRNAPAEIVLRLPHPAGAPIRSVLLNGRKLSAFEKAHSLIRLRPTAGPMALQVWYASVPLSPN